MNHWQSLIGGVPVPGDYWAEPVKTNGHALSADRPVVRNLFPAAAIVHTRGRKGVRLIPIQAMDFFNAAPPHNP